MVLCNRKIQLLNTLIINKSKEIIVNDGKFGLYTFVTIGLIFDDASEFLF